MSETIGPDDPVRLDRLETHRIVEELRRLLIAEYVFSDIGKRLAAHLAERLHAAAYDDVTDPAALAERVTRDLQSVNGDRHLRLLFSTDEVVSEADPQAQMQALARLAASTAGGIARVERLEGNVGYLELKPILFPPAMAGDQMTNAMSLLASSDALIIDVRQCRGGDPSMVVLACSYLFGDDPVHLIDIYERRGDRTNQHWTQPFVPGSRFGPDKPLYILTSKYTFSGAEDLCYDLQRLRRAIVVGEATGGGAHPREGFRLHRHLEATIPVARALDPETGRNWEGTGVIPDIPVSPAEALACAIDHLSARSG